MSESFCKPAVLVNSPAPVGAADAGHSTSPPGAAPDPPPSGAASKLGLSPVLVRGMPLGVSRMRKEALWSGKGGTAGPPPGPRSIARLVIRDENETPPSRSGSAVPPRGGNRMGGLRREAGGTRGSLTHQVPHHSSFKGADQETEKLGCALQNTRPPNGTDAPMSQSERELRG